MYGILMVGWSMVICTMYPDDEPVGCVWLASGAERESVAGMYVCVAAGGRVGGTEAGPQQRPFTKYVVLYRSRGVKTRPVSV